MSKLQGKVAVITGGNSGIGLAIARHFQDNGAHVAISGRDADTLTEAANLLGSKALVVKADVTSTAELTSFYQQVSDRFGRVDILVANAGVAKFAPLEHTDEALFDTVSDINFKGAFFSVKQVLPFFNDKGGSIVITGSGVSTRGVVNGSVYAATKAAVRSLARSLSAELVSRGIRVNTLSPGPIETPIFARTGLSKEQLDEFAGGILKSVPLARFGNVDEMARAALFLASDDSSYVVGADLVADGGYSTI